jgi:hypothetical protein
MESPREGIMESHSLHLNPGSARRNSHFEKPLSRFLFFFFQFIICELRIVVTIISGFQED